MNRALALAVVVLLTACGGEAAPDVATDGLIERDLFVQTYVELRIESFNNTPKVITTGERDVILAERNVSEEELRFFLEVHGPDVPYMRDLWAEIEAQILNFLSPETDSLDGDPVSSDGNSGSSDDKATS